MVKLDEIIKVAADYDSEIKIVPVVPDELVFELNTKINCFYCGRYNSSWRCPPRIPEIDYPRMMHEFANAAFVYKSFVITEDNKDTLRSDSTNHIHKCLLGLEKYLYSNNVANALSFIGGSCKLCKTGCGAEKCSNPYLARIPVEATGINVVKTLAKKGVDIVFPADKEIKRVGLLLWN